MPVASGKVYPLRLDDETRARFERAAKKLKVSLAEFLRDAGEARCVEVERGTAARRRAGVEPLRHQTPAAALTLTPTERASKRVAVARHIPRTQMCEHRRGPDEFCSRCDS